MQESSKGEEWEAIKGISHTYIFFQSLGVVLQAYQGGNIKAPRTSQDPASLAIVRRQPLKRLGLQGSCLLHPIQREGVKAWTQGQRQHMVGPLKGPKERKSTG